LVVTTISEGPGEWSVICNMAKRGNMRITHMLKKTESPREKDDRSEKEGTKELREKVARVLLSVDPLHRPGKALGEENGRIVQKRKQQESHLATPSPGEERRLFTQEEKNLQRSRNCEMPKDRREHLGGFRCRKGSGGPSIVLGRIYEV